MKMSKMIIPTLREVPAEAEIQSHKLMLRAGMIRKVASGVYTQLPFGLKALKKVESIVRDEMNNSGAQEILCSALIPAELWQESGRWDAMGKEMFRLQDRHERDFCLGPTHEEVFTDLEAHPDALTKLIDSSENYFDEPFKDHVELQTHLTDDIVESIREEEIYMADKTGTKPRPNRM